jgi:DNA-binding response OmpR family regulator
MPDLTPAIFVVEDAPDILIVLRRVLRDLQLDYDLITADNAHSARAHAEHHGCALLITDYMLGETNGLELAREFKTRFGCSVVLITAYATPELRLAAEMAGIEYFIPKPFFVDDLEIAVRALLSRPRR